MRTCSVVRHDCWVAWVCVRHPICPVACVQMCGCATVWGVGYVSTLRPCVGVRWTASSRLSSPSPLVASGLPHGERSEFCFALRLQRFAEHLQNRCPVLEFPCSGDVCARQAAHSLQVRRERGRHGGLLRLHLQRSGSRGPTLPPPPPPISTFCCFFAAVCGRRTGATPFAATGACWTAVCRTLGREFCLSSSMSSTPRVSCQLHTVSPHLPLYLGVFAADSCMFMYCGPCMICQGALLCLASPDTLSWLRLPP